MKNTVFAVHNYETCDDMHHVSILNDQCDFANMAFKFKNWQEAERFAKSAAEGLGLKTYTIDEPARPHKKIKV